MDAPGRVPTPGQLLACLATFELLLAAAHVASTLLAPPIGHMSVWFDLDEEATIPSWFSSSQLLVIGLVFFGASVYQGVITRPSPLSLRVFGLLFVYLSMDEAAVIHENLTRFLKNLAWLPRFRGNHGIWIFLYTAAGLLLIAVTYKDLGAMWRYHARPAQALAAGLATMAIGGVGIETLSYYIDHEVSPTRSQLLVGLEEFLEMLGGSVMLLGGLALLRRVVRAQAGAPVPAAPPSLETRA